MFHIFVNEMRFLPLGDEKTSHSCGFEGKDFCLMVWVDGAEVSSSSSQKTALL